MKKKNPLLTICISTFQQLNCLKLLIEAIKKQSFKDYELIICDDGSTDGTTEWLKKNHPEIRHYWQENKGFRLARARNLGLKDARGKYFVTIEGDCIPDKEWLAAYIPHLRENWVLMGLRRHIKKLPSKLDYKEINNSFLKEEWRIEGFIEAGKTGKKRVSTGPNYAVGANMVLPTEKLKAIGGWDDRFEGWGSDDCDVTLRLIHEQKCETRAIPASVVFHVYHERKEQTPGNVALFGERQRWYERKIQIVAYPSPGGARQYRLDQIAKYINSNEKDAVMVVSSAPMHEDALSGSDVIILQQTVDPQKISWAWAYAKEQGKLLVAELDDYIDVKKEHPLYEQHKELDAPRWTRALLKVADIVTVTTDHLAEEIKEYNENVFVLKNCLDMELWGLPPLENESDEIRVGFFGSCTHREDLRMIKPAIMELLGKYPKMRFIYAGDGWLWKNKFFGTNSQLEYVEPVPVDEWPARLRSLRLDISLVPLIDNKFNLCKSNLKWAEGAVYKIPSVLSSVVYSKTVKDGKTGLIADTPKDFIKLTSKLIENKKMRKEIGENAYRDVRANYDIKDHYRNWLDLYIQKYREKHGKYL